MTMAMLMMTSNTNNEMTFHMMRTTKRLNDIHTPNQHHRAQERERIKHTSKPPNGVGVHRAAGGREEEEKNERTNKQSA